MPMMTDAAQEAAVKSFKQKKNKPKTQNSFFTPKEVAKLVNISYRQIQYWDKTRFIWPSCRRRGKYRLYTFADLILLKLARVLRDYDFSIQRLRKTVEQIKKLLAKASCTLIEITFVIYGDCVLMFNGDMVLMNSLKGENCIIFSARSLWAEVNEKFPWKEA